MAEALGLAASVAGLVGLAGQLFNGCMFVKGFLDDAKNAPEDIRALHKEIEILAAAAQDASRIFKEVGRSGGGIDNSVDEDGVENAPTNFSNSQYQQALEQCIDAVTTLGKKIESEVQKFGGKHAKLWDQMKAATRKKSLAEYVTRIERTKTQLMMVMQNLSMDFQLGEKQSLRSTAGAIIAWTGQTDLKMSNLASHVEGIKDKVDSVATTVATLAMPQNQRESCALEAIIGAVVSRELKKHHSEVTQQEERFLHFPEVGSRHETLEPVSYAQSHCMTRRDKVIHRSCLKTPLFDLEINTSEINYVSQCQDRQQNSSSSLVSPTQVKRVTKYHVRLKIPFWKFGLIFKSGNPDVFYDSSPSMSFRTYNIVPDNAPIFKACREFDLPEVRRLFEERVASPLDQDYWGRSLIDVVLSELWSVNLDKRKVRKAANATLLLRFLIDCLSGNALKPRNLWLALYLAYYWKKSDRDLLMDEWAEAFRLVLMNSSENPIELSVASYFMSLRFSVTHIYDILVSQQRWWIDYDIRNFIPALKDCFVENDIQMLKDPSGVKMKEAVSKGISYIPHSLKGYWWYQYDETMYSPFHFLLGFARCCSRDDILECCKVRLGILLDSGYDPRFLQPVRADFKSGFGLLGEILSVTGYAQRWDLEKLWQSGLERAGWSSFEIEALFDEETYTCVPDLLDGHICYTTRDEQQKEYIETLRCGGFASLKQYEIESLCRKELEFELGIDYHNLEKVMHHAASLVNQRRTPGSWPQEQEFKLMPGIDFKLARGANSSRLDRCMPDMKDWKCIREIWDTELGGCVPTDCELPIFSAPV